MRCCILLAVLYLPMAGLLGQPVDSVAPPSQAAGFWNQTMWKRESSNTVFLRSGLLVASPQVAALQPLWRRQRSTLAVGISTQFVQSSQGWVGSHPFQPPTGFPGFPNYVPHSVAPTISHLRGGSASFLRMGELLGPSPQLLAPRTITIGKAWIIR